MGNKFKSETSVLYVGEATSESAEIVHQHCQKDHEKHMHRELEISRGYPSVLRKKNQKTISFKTSTTEDDLTLAECKDIDFSWWFPLGLLIHAWSLQRKPVNFSKLSEESEASEKPLRPW